MIHPFLKILSELGLVINFLGGVVIFSLALFVSLRKKKPAPELTRYPSIMVLIPCHNEEGNIGECIESALNADYPGEKKIVVVDDASTDRSREVISRYASSVRILSNPVQIGKSRSMNRALELNDCELLAVLDGDSFIGKDALRQIAACFVPSDVGVVTSTVRVRNINHLVCWFFYLDYLSFSMLRHSLSAVNANIYAPGQLSVFRSKAVREVHGFNPQGLCEDTDITFRIVRSGYRSAFSEHVWVETMMPYRPLQILRQRIRWTAGNFYIFRLYLRPGRHVVNWFTLPITMFWWTLWSWAALPSLIQMFSNLRHYWRWTLAKIFLMRFTSLGLFEWLYHAWHHDFPVSIFIVVSLGSGVLYFMFTACSILRYERKLWFQVLVAFMFWPLYLTIFFNLITILAIPYLFIKEQPNIWKKVSVEKLVT